jgi:CPA2 family monovalent cation:H+ antiporter-2
MRTTEEIRHGRYAILRSVFRRRGAEPLPETRSLRQQLRNVILPPGAYAVGRSIEDLALGKLRLQVTAIRREGILGRSPVPTTRLREGDTLVLFGAPEDLELGESFLLAG